MSRRDPNLHRIEHAGKLIDRVLANPNHRCAAGWLAGAFAELAYRGPEIDVDWPANPVEYLAQFNLRVTRNGIETIRPPALDPELRAQLSPALLAVCEWRRTQVMNNKKNKQPETDPIRECETALEAARADLERAQAAILEADPSEVIERRDHALVCEAAVRKAERALLDARGKEAARDRERRLSELASVTDEPATVQATLRSHADKIAALQKEFVSAYRQGLDAAIAFDQRAKAAVDLASSLGVPHTRNAPCSEVREIRDGLVTNVQPGGVWASVLAQALYAQRALPLPSMPVPARTLNDLARDVGRFLFVAYPAADELKDLQAAGVDDQLMLDLILNGVLTQYRARRRTYEAAHKQAEQRRGLAQWRTAIQRDITETLNKGRRKGDPVSEFAHRANEELKGGWDAITTELVNAVRTRYPKGFAAGLELDPADIERPLPTFDARAVLNELGVNLSRAEATAAE
jgi:hypothetical protein